MEIWKPIEGTEGEFEISNKGNVRSKRKGRVYKILKPMKDSKGYLRIRNTINRERITFKIHREVAKAFIPNPEDKPQVNHINGIKDDNMVENLEWITGLENARHALRNGLWDKNIEVLKKANKQKRRPVKAININTGEIIYFKTVSDAEKEIGTRHVCAVIKGKRNQSKGYKFEYID